MKVKFNLRSLATFLLGIFATLNVMAQDITVKGVVIDAFGDPIMGATVLQVGTTNGCVTDLDGNFSLKAPKDAIIRFSFIGYRAQEIPAAENMNVTLQEDSELLEDVVVIGYGTAKKSDLTGAVTAIKPDEKNKGVVASAQDMMQGKIAGVNVTNNGGSPGGQAQIRVRGGSSLNASNDPLIVIDGMAMDNQGIKGAPNPLALVNPNDIETFTVLKDASATAIYGSRGSNGVIIITTKKGRAGAAPQVSYNGNVTFGWANDRQEVLNGDEYRKFIYDYYGPDSEAWSKVGWKNTDWQDQIYRTAVSHEHNVTVTGAMKNLPYRLSVGFADQQGTLKTSDYKRTNVGLNVNPSFLDNHLKVTAGVKFFYSRAQYANTAAIGEATRMDPTHGIYFDEQEWKGSHADNMNNYFTWTDDASALNDPNWDRVVNRNTVKNPVALLNEKDDRANSRDWQGTLDLDYKVHNFEDLLLHVSLNGDYANGQQDTDYADWGPSNMYYGNYGSTHEEKYNLTLNAWAQYNKDFNEANHFDVMVGYEWSHMKYWGNSNYAGLYPMTNLDKPGQLYNESNNIWRQESFLVSFLGRMNYSLLDRYSVTLNIRDDGSSRFKDHWALFYSGALAWKIKNEAFLADVDWLSEAKVRASYGKTGQQDGIGNYKYFASYNVNSNNIDGRYPILGVNDSGLLYRPDAYNANLKWETTTTTNVGLDLGFLRDRFTLSAEWYYRKTTDLLNEATVSAGSNFRNKVTSNIGSLKNTGFEVSTVIRPIQTKNWNWEINANLTYNENKIIELNGDGSIIRYFENGAGTGNYIKAWASGQSASAFYVYQQVYDEKGKPVEGVYVDRNGDGQISESDLYFYKQGDAPWMVGLSTRVEYKNWDLGLSFHSHLGNYVYNGNEMGKMNIEKRYDSSFGYLQNATAAGIERNFNTYENHLSDYWITNASFLKLDNITLGYSFSNLFKTGKYQGIGGRAYVVASNVMTITNYKGIDPEQNNGFENSLYPRPFNLQVGLTLNF